MLRQEVLAFIKVLSTFKVFPAVLKELRMALSRRKNKPLEPVGIRNTMTAGRARAPNLNRNNSRAKAKATSQLAPAAR
jgi:hypothetical protein